ncbi:hypothetical protein [Burkholderia ubonensis]|uniref:hypothetical protein n=1 Tax=Burkholderia ubonensis TaxID=101571 RepID=UPI000AF122ED|nr:hypothetical protein [Burkholderia ubonensis]
MDQRQELYRGHQLDVAIDGDEASGYYIARQTARFAPIGSSMNVPFPTARFADREAAFSDAFGRLRAVVDNREGRPGD